MLSENIKTLRKAKGLSQQEFAIKLNVVRQTISKWEQGLSVPDSDMLIAISKALETPVSTLLGETIDDPKADDLKAISEKLEVINLQLAKRSETRRKWLHRLFIFLGISIAIVVVILAGSNSPYLNWTDGDPETVVFKAAFHVFEWLFIRLAPIVLLIAVIGGVATRRK